jgi:hypothetical protein
MELINRKWNLYVKATNTLYRLDFSPMRASTQPCAQDVFTPWLYWRAEIAVDRGATEIGLRQLGTVRAVPFEYSLAPLDPRPSRRAAAARARAFVLFSSVTSASATNSPTQWRERIWGQPTRRTSMSSIPAGILRFG